MWNRMLYQLARIMNNTVAKMVCCWCRNRHIAQWARKENLDTDSYTCGNLIFSEGKIANNGEGKLFQ